MNYTWPIEGSFWKYIGRNPTLRDSDEFRGPPRSPTVRVLPHDSRLLVGFQDMNRSGDRSRHAYTIEKFARYFVPFPDINEDRLIQLKVLVQLNLDQGVTKEDIHNLLVKLEV